MAFKKWNIYMKYLISKISGISKLYCKDTIKSDTYMFVIDKPHALRYDITFEYL